MDDGPPRCLILFGDGFLSDLNNKEEEEEGDTSSRLDLDSDRWASLHNLARTGCSGFLALRKLSDEVTPKERLEIELAQVWDIYDTLQLGHDASLKGKKDGKTEDKILLNDKTAIPSLSERFMNLSAGMISNSAAASELAKRAGFSLVPLGPSEKEQASDLQDPEELAERIVSMLGLSGDSTEDDVVKPKPKRFDLLFLHLDAEEIGRTCALPPPSSLTRSLDVRRHGASKGLAWMDSLVGEIQKFESRPDGKRVGSHLYLVVLMGYGSECLGKEALDGGAGVGILRSELTVPGFSTLPEDLRKLRPLQSYQSKNGVEIANAIRDNHPILAVHYLNGATRCDHAKRMGVIECQQKGSNSAILADRFLPEIAFKIGHAPKYGA